MDLGRSKQHHFRSLKKNRKKNICFLAISLQTDAKVHEYVRVRQCQRSYVIEQNFAVILHREAPADSCQIYSL
jgi:hypothetical protein